MMREAQKMMQDPAFQAQMDKLMSQQGMKQALKKTKKDMADPKKVAELEAKARKAVEEGEKELEKLSKNQKALQKKLEVKDADRKEGAEAEDSEKSSGEDSKPAATGEQDDMPDIPALNLN